MFTFLLPKTVALAIVSTGRLFLGLFGCRIFLLWFEIIFWRFGMVLYEIFTLFLLTTFARGWFSGKHFLISCRNFWKVHMELLENIVKFPWGGGWVVCKIILMSNPVEKLIQAIIKMENELKMKLKLKPNIGMSLHITVVDTTQKWNEIKLLNRKIEIENEVKEIKSKMKLKSKQNIGMSVHVAVVNTA